MTYAIVMDGEFETLGGVALKVREMKGSTFPAIVTLENGTYRELTQDEYDLFHREYDRPGKMAE